MLTGTQVKSVQSAEIVTYSSQSTHCWGSQSPLALAWQQLAKAEYANAGFWEENFGLMRD